MTQSNQRIDINAIDALAAEWAVRQHLRGLTADEQRELDCWLEADSRHSGALLRARAAWADLDRLVALSGRSAPQPPSRDAARADITVRSIGSDVSRPAPREQHAVDEAEYLPPRGLTRRWLFAAGAAAAVLGFFGTWLLRPSGERYVSAVGEVRSVTLSDGSSMVLNTATEATVRFDPARREIDLANGEGVFNVAKDPNRPFIVRTGSVVVRAVGTVFAVRTVRGRVDVTVTEGVVELVEESGSGPSIVRRAAANEHAVVEESGQVEVQRMPSDEAERRLAWREGMLDFAGEPLATAVEEINRHNTKRVVVDDPGLSGRPVVGLFRADDPESFAAIVAAALGLESVAEDGAIHLRQGPHR